MNRKEMLLRLKKGEDPLELSIEKWQDIVDGKGEDWHSENCALCENDVMMVDQDESLNDCDSCIVCQTTNETDCFGTPFIKYHNAKNDGKSNSVLISLAQKEVEFLKSLRKETKK